VEKERLVVETTGFTKVIRTNV